MLILALPVIIAATPLPVVTVDRDNVKISESCIVEITADLIQDEDNNGVIHVAADGITIEFSNEHRELIAATKGTPWDTLAGIGIRIDGHRNVTIRNARVNRFKVGIYATNADGLVLETCDIAGGFQHRLRSTPKAEDSGDWLWPHHNDDHEWMSNYGAGIYVENSKNVTIRGCFARRRQNGIILDRVNDSKIYDNDCSFLSGWGLAMWRSNRNVISRNAFDFCVRGYSHGVYNRGQDSAGILMFEQCSDNVIAENSTTHCGDGFFGFAGNEALGEVNPRDDRQWYKGRGNNNNVLISNDFSYAAAHGIEMTFSFKNKLISNRLVGNAICGIWGGYSQDTLIAGNVLQDNGEMAYGTERGGINIEHGRNNRIEHNAFAKNKCGVFLWWDRDERLLQLPWATQNERGSIDNNITCNQFTGDVIAIQLRRTSGTAIGGNVITGVANPNDTGQEPQEWLEMVCGEFATQTYPVLGDTRPVGARKHLQGREHIIMTEWGPYDWASPYLLLADAQPGRHVYRLLGRDAHIDPKGVDLSGEVQSEIRDDRLIITPTALGSLTPYRIEMIVGDRRLVRRGVLSHAEWTIQVFAYQTDPREDVEAWRAEAADILYTVHDESLDLRFGGGGLDDVKQLPKVLPKDHFGTFASATLTFPAGKWRINTTSDDGIRVWLGEDLVIDDWTWHPPKQHTYEFTLNEPKQIPIRVEHFELKGYAILSLQIDAVE